MIPSDQQPSGIEERRLKLDQERLRLESSFARKWLPGLAAILVAIVAGSFTYVEHRKTEEAAERTKIETREATERMRMEIRAKDEREWGLKVVEMYFNKRELFDLTRNRDQAEDNLRILFAIAPPNAAQSVFAFAQARIPAPVIENEGNDSQRLQSLAAVARIQNAIKSAKGEMKPSEFLVYIQYAEASRDVAEQAQKALQEQGFRAPGIEQVRKVPSRLQVRYYRPEQKHFAGDLATRLGKMLGLHATADNAIEVKSTKELPSGILELWLPQVTAQ
jgi:hypothetical protein